MSNSAKFKAPKYCHHKATDRARVRVHGQYRFLPGKFNSRESRQAYQQVLDDLTQQFLQAREADTTPDPVRGDCLVVELMIAYLKHADVYYARSNEAENIRLCLRPVRENFSGKQVDTIGPEQWKRIRQWFIDNGQTRSGINKSMARILSMFRWGAQEQLVKVTTYETLKLVEPLKKGRCGDVPEAKKRGAVSGLFPQARSAKLKSVQRSFCITGDRTSTVSTNTEPEMTHTISREISNTFPRSQDLSQEQVAYGTRGPADKLNKCFTLLCGGLLLVMVGMCNAQTISEDFNDGDDHGWIPHEVVYAGNQDVIDGTFRLTTVDSVPAGDLGHVISRFDTQSPIGDGFLRAKLTANTHGTSPGIALFSSSDPPEYYVFNGSSESGNFSLWRSNGEAFLPNLLDVDRKGLLASSPSLKTGDAWWLEIGIVEGLVSAKAWPEGSSIPSEPQLTFFDRRPHPIADFGVAGWISTAWRSPTQVDASFDDISFRPVPEPSSGAVTGLVFAAFAIRWLLCRSTRQL